MKKLVKINLQMYQFDGGSEGGLKIENNVKEIICEQL